MVEDGKAKGVSGTFEVFLSRTNILARCLRQRRFSACLRSKHCCMAPLTQANGAGVGTGVSRQASTGFLSSDLLLETLGGDLGTLTPARVSRTLCGVERCARQGLEF
ncbi:unnamed protein product [Gadus morhua 'NCC']